MMPSLRALLHTVSSTTGFTSPTASPQWQQYLAAPYAHDTLAPLLGALSVTVQSKYAPPVARPDLTGITNAAGDTVTMYGRPNDTYFTHELGHIVDVQNLAPDISSQVARLYDPKRAGLGYAATNDFEYVAEAFRSAMDVYRSAPDTVEKNLAKAEKRLPGVTLWFKWIQQRLAKKATS